MSDTIKTLRELSERLTETESALSAFFNMREELFTVFSREGYFIKVNSQWEKVLGWTPEEMCAQHYSFFVHPDDVTRSAEAEKAMDNGVHVKKFENRYRCKDGSYRTIVWDAPAFFEGKYSYTVARVGQDDAE